MLYALFRAIRWCLNFMCQHFGTNLKHKSLTSTILWLTPTRALSPSRTFPWPPCGSLPSTACFRTRTRPLLCHPSSCWLRLYSSQTFSSINTPTFSNLVILHTYLPVKIEQTDCSETSAYKIQTPGELPRRKHTT